MQQKGKQTAIAAKIKKWVEAALELSNNYKGFALPITRLTSIKSLCQDTIAAEKFALYLSKLILQQASDAPCPDNTTPEEWEIHKSLMSDAIAQMENFLESPTPIHTQSFFSLLKQIDSLQGDDYRNVHWTTVHFVLMWLFIEIQICNLLLCETRVRLLRLQVSKRIYRMLRTNLRYGFNS